MWWRPKSLPGLANVVLLMWAEWLQVGVTSQFVDHCSVLLTVACTRSHMWSVKKYMIYTDFGKSVKGKITLRKWVFTVSFVFCSLWMGVPYIWFSIYFNLNYCSEVHASNLWFIYFRRVELLNYHSKLNHRPLIVSSVHIIYYCTSDAPLHFHWKYAFRRGLLRLQRRRGLQVKLPLLIILTASSSLLS